VAFRVGIVSIELNNSQQAEAEEACLAAQVSLKRVRALVESSRVLFTPIPPDQSGVTEADAQPLVDAQLLPPVPSRG
jgi:hypothetical protein